MHSKDSLFIVLSFLQALVFVAYSLPLPIYPGLALSKNITKDVIGLIFACYPITHLLTSFLFGKMMMRWDRKKVVLYCLLSLTFATMVFGLVDLITDPFPFIFFSIVSRLLQGCGVAGYNVVCFAIFPKLYPDTLQEKLGYFAVACGVGISIGPILGGVLFSLVNYEFVFFSVASLYLILWAYLKKNLDFSDLERDSDDVMMEIDPKDEIGYGTFFRSFQFVLTILCQILSVVSVVLLYPTLGDRIFKLGGTTLTISMAFAVNTLCYSGIVMVSNYFALTQKLHRRVSICIGFFLCIISLYVIANTENLEQIVIGMGIMGFGHFFVLLPIIPEIIDIGSKFPSNSPNKEDVVNDLSAALFNAAFGLTEFIGPILGGFLDVTFGFSHGIYLYLVFCLAFWIIYLILGGGLQAMKKPCVVLDEKDKENLRNSGLFLAFRSAPSPRSSVIRRGSQNSIRMNGMGSGTGLKEDYLQEIQKKLMTHKV